MGDFSYTSFGYLKDYALKKMPWKSFGIYVYAWSLCGFFNMGYNPESYFLEN